MKKIISRLIYCLLLAFLFSLSISAVNDIHATSIGSGTNSPPIAEGKTNRSTNVYWGRSEMFPAMVRLTVNTGVDIYEYDKDWVMVLYDTTVTYGGKVSAQSFYGFIKRAHVTCDPPLDGDKSAKAKTGPGRPKKQTPEKEAPSEDGSVPADKPEPSQDKPKTEPSIPVEELEEYDWIIRTPGKCRVDVDAGDGVVFTAEFAMMAQKFGGIAPSSDPLYNVGKSNPYAATGFFSLTTEMADMLENLGVSKELTGFGGVNLTGQCPGSVFYINTKYADAVTASFTLEMQATATVNPLVTDGIVKQEFNMSTQSKLSLPVQLKGGSGGYKFIILGMRPGGGNLVFPAVLEKHFTDSKTRDKWKKEAKDADTKRKQTEEAKRKAKDLQEKVLEQMKKDAKRDMESKESEPEQPNDPAGEDELTPGPLIVKEGEDELELSPLTVPDGDKELELSPLTVPDGDKELELSPLTVPDGETELEPEPLVVPDSDKTLEPGPLIVPDGERVDNFPERNNRP